MADPPRVPRAFSALFNNRAVAAEAAGRTVFVFPGHGFHWLDMAKELLDSAPAFADEIRACDAAFSEHLGWSLLDVILGDGDRSDVPAPVTFAVMVSLAAQWRDLGIHPDAVLGHSHGEIAAAYVAGGLTLSDAAGVVVRRAEAISALAEAGGTIAVGWPVEQVLSVIERWRHAIVVAAYDGPSSTVVTGEAAAVDELVIRLERDGVSAIRVPVDYAVPADRTEELRAALRGSLSGLRPQSAEVPFISSVTGAALDTSILDGDYWFANLCQPVLFEQAVRWSHRHGYHTFIEVSAEPVLIGAVRESLAEFSGRAHAESQ